MAKISIPLPEELSVTFTFEHMTFKIPKVLIWPYLISLWPWPLTFWPQNCTQVVNLAKFRQAVNL